MEYYSSLKNTSQWQAIESALNWCSISYLLDLLDYSHLEIVCAGWFSDSWRVSESIADRYRFNRYVLGSGEVFYIY